MDNYLAEPNPNAGAALLHQLFREKLKNSFIALIKECGRVFNQTFQQQLDSLTILNAARKFSPHIYSNYYSLLAFMVKNDRQNCRKLCENLSAILANEELYASELHIINFQNKEWDLNFVNEILNHSNQAVYNFISEPDFELNKAHIYQALETIKLSSNEMYSEIRDHLNLIELVDGSFAIYSASSVKYLGALPIAIPAQSINPVYYYFDVIIHEGSHQHLNILMGLDPIVLNKPDQTFISPARKVPRPMKGIFHAHFVFYRLILLYKLAYNFFNTGAKEPGPKDKHLDNIRIKELPWDFNLRLSAYQHKFREGEMLIKAHAQLSEQGWELFNNMSKNFKTQLE
jgi:hypothetical protein